MHNFAEKEVTMRKVLFALIALTFSAFTASAQSTAKGCNDVSNDTINASGNVSRPTTKDIYRLTATKDSMKYILNSRNYDKNAVTMPKYDAFNEKMKNDDWLGGLLKNILFR